MKNIVIATGGTGGHIYPALAFAKCFAKEHKDVKIIFIGSKDRMEAKLIPSYGYEYYGLDMSGMNGGLVAKMKSAVSLMKAEHWCRNFLRDVKPMCCIGFGNYISVPLIMAAHKLHIPTMIHEQNSFAGKANKLLGKYADAIATCYESTNDVFPIEKTRVLGNPQATLAVEQSEDRAILEEFGLDQTKPTVFFMMGSLGSSSVSKVIDEALPYIDENVQVIIASGKANDYSFKTKSTDRIKIVPYVDGTKMLKACDLAITRAGATTLCELTAIGCASVLIPSPYVPNNHQVFNAMELVKNNASIMLEEKDLNAKSLSDLVNSLMHDETKRNAMRQNASKLGKTNAAYDMIAWIEEFFN